MLEDRTWLRAATVVLGAMVLQYVVVDQAVIFGAHPDLLIVLPVTAGIVAGAEMGALLGFVAGVAADLIVPTPFGLSMVVFVLVGYGAGAFVASSLGREFSTARVSGAVLGCGVGTLLFGLVATVAGQPGLLGAHLLVTAAVVAAGGLVLAPPVYIVWGWALRSARHMAFGSRVPSSGSALRS